MKSRISWLEGIYCAFCVLLASVGHAQQLHFSSIEGLVEQEISRLILPQIYARLSIDITITPLPAKRAQFEADSGISDGEIMRIHSYGEEIKNVIRVPYSLLFPRNKRLCIEVEELTNTIVT